MEEPDNAIIFCNTRDDTALVTAVLNRNGFDAELLNGDLPQKERERVMAKVKRGEVALHGRHRHRGARHRHLATWRTSSTTRCPRIPAVYLHRVGRTGRIGKKGTAINLVSGRELATLHRAGEEVRHQVREARSCPTPEEARKLWTERHVRELREAAAAPRSTRRFSPLAQELKKRAGRRAPHRLPAQVLLHPPPHGEGARPSSPSSRRRRPRPRPRARRSASGRPKRERSEKPASEPSATAPGTENGEPRRRPERKRREETGGEERGARLWCNLGEADGLDAPALQDALTQLSGVAREQIREIQLRRTHSYVYVAPEAQERLTGITGQEREGKALKLEAPRR